MRVPLPDWSSRQPQALEVLQAGAEGASLDIRVGAENAGQRRFDSGIGVCRGSHALRICSSHSTKLRPWHRKSKTSLDICVTP